MSERNLTYQMQLSGSFYCHHFVLFKIILNKYLTIKDLLYVCGLKSF